MNVYIPHLDITVTDRIHAAIEVLYHLGEIMHDKSRLDINIDDVPNAISEGSLPINTLIDFINLTHEERYIVRKVYVMFREETYRILLDVFRKVEN